MDDIVLAPFDYGKLDADDAKVRIRLESTCVECAMPPTGWTSATCAAGRSIASRPGTRCSPAFISVIPYIMPELPAGQREALAKNVKHADRLHQCGDPQLASLGRARRSTTSPLRCRSTAASSSTSP